MSKKTHGMSKSPEYITWQGIKKRCHNRNGTECKGYSDRGITVHESWINSFEQFYKDMGPRPSNKHSIDRIDNNGNYDPSNCRWADCETQINNRRSSRLYDFLGQMLSVPQLNRICGISKSELRRRLDDGMNIYMAMSKPTRKRSPWTIIYKGETNNINYFCRKYGVAINTAKRRLTERNLPLEEVFRSSK